MSLPPNPPSASLTKYSVSPVGHKDGCGGVVALGLQGRETLFHIRKDLWVRTAELIDALLDVTYHKAMIASYECKYRILNLIDILILVDLHLVIAIRKIFCIFCRGSVIAEQ